MSRKIVKYLLIAVGLLYLVMRTDFIPDGGLIGFADDLLFALFLVWRYRVFIGHLASQSNDHKNNTPKKERKEAALDPYSVLGVNKKASSEEIDSQYKLLMGKYHPDKVHHLADEFQRMAHEKTIQIQSAYNSLKKKRA